MASTAERVAYRHVYARVFRAMSMADALETLGLPAGSSPTPEEVKKAQRQMAFRHHPDRGGDAKKQIEVNVAADILLGRERPTGGGYTSTPEDYGYGGYSAGPAAKPPREEIVTFEEAKSAAGIPSSIEWLFVTTTHSSGYSSDEFTNRAMGWVAVGQTDKAWVFVAAENWHRQDHVPGGTRGKKDIWEMYSHAIPKGQPVTARLFYGEVRKAWKSFEYMEKRFNSKVVPADGWTFSERLPKGNNLSIKNFLLNFGLMTEEALGGAPRKYEIKVNYERGDRQNPGAGFYVPKYQDPYKLHLIINGKEYTLPERAVAQLTKLRPKMGKDFMDWMFGDYYYGGETKVLTRKREGKQVMAWMAEHLSGLPEWVTQALVAASTAKPSGGSRRRRR